jgi:hypothetical protein
VRQVEISLEGSLRIAGRDGIDVYCLQQAALVASTATELATSLGVSSVTISVKASSVGAMSAQSCVSVSSLMTSQPQAPATVMIVLFIVLAETKPNICCKNDSVSAHEQSGLHL